MATLRSLIVSLQARTEQFERGMQRATRELEGLRRQTTATQSLFAGLQRSVIGMAAGFASFQVLQQVGTHIVQAGLAAERTSTAFRAIAGSALAGRQEMAFVAETANRLGVDLTSLESSYQKLLAASKGTVLEGQKTRDIFTAITQAGKVLQLSSDEVEGALNAVQQMISKGTVSAEELRGQLGERLPGAFQIAARAMGVTTAELGKMLEQGQIMSETFLPRFASQIQRELGKSVEQASQTASSNLARVGNAITILTRNLASSGLIEWVGTLAAAWANVVTQADAAKRKHQEVIEQRRARLVQEGGAFTPGPQAMADLQAIEDQMKRIGVEQDKLRKQLAEPGLAAVIREQLLKAQEQQQQRLEALRKQQEAVITRERERQRLERQTTPRDESQRAAQVQAFAEMTAKEAQAQKDLHAALVATDKELQTIRNTTKFWQDETEKVRAEMQAIEKAMEAIQEKFGKRDPTSGGLMIPATQEDIALMAKLEARHAALQRQLDATTQARKDARATEREEEQARKESLRATMVAGREYLKMLEKETTFLDEEVQIQEALQKQSQERFETEKSLVDEIFREAQALTMSNEQLQNQALRNAGASQSTWNFVEALRAVITEEQAHTALLETRDLQGGEIEQIVSGLTRERDALRLSTRELLVRELALNKAGEASTQMALALQDEIERLQMAREAADMVTDALIDMAVTGEINLKNLQESFSRLFLSMLADAIKIRESLTKLIEKGLELAINALPTRPAGTGTASTSSSAQMVQWAQTSGYGGGLQHGGPVMPGRFYTVGESGPELLVAGASGTVVPGGGRPVVINMTVNTPDADSFRRSQNQIAAQMVAAASRARRVM